LSKINDPKIVTERLKKDIIKLLIDEVVIEGESVKIFATIPLPNKIHEREMDKTDIPGTFNAGATLGPVNETNMARIWNKPRIAEQSSLRGRHKQSNTPLKRKVFVAMSGGVDSSVAAALLKEQGYFVSGGFMKNFSPESWEGILASDCPWEQDFADVQAVCEKLGIECRSFNFEKEYKEKVIEYFFNEYQAGRTPNPDVMCNKEIKFNLFLNKALYLGYDYIATGHYARVTPDLELLKGLDPKKDQSYFLYTLNREQLSHVLFPIGHLQKTEVRKLARKFELPNAEKKDSQGICFIGHVNVREFLKQRIPERAGEIVGPNGQIIGTHNGAWYYTIGQRHGLGLGGGTPYYVAKKDVVNNIITVTDSKTTEAVEKSAADLGNIHWVSGSPPDFPLRCKAKIRYQQADQDCVVYDSKIEFMNPQFAIASGQAVVLYDGDKVLGGATIH